jgi:hypothetical protein
MSTYIEIYVYQMNAYDEWKLDIGADPGFLKREVSRRVDIDGI